MGQRSSVAGHRSNGAASEGERRLSYVSLVAFRLVRLFVQHILEYRCACRSWSFACGSLDQVFGLGVSGSEMFPC